MQGVFQAKEKACKCLEVKKLDIFKALAEGQGHHHWWFLYSCYHDNNLILFLRMGFPDSSVGKESACNAGDPSSIPGLGRYPGEGVGYPLQCSWASLVAQLVKNLPAMWEIWA